MAIILSQQISISTQDGRFLSIDGKNAIVDDAPCNWSVELADPNSPDGPYTILYHGPNPPDGLVLPCLALYRTANPDGSANVVTSALETPPHKCQTFSFQEIDDRYVTPNVVPNKSLLLSLSPAPLPKSQPG